MKHVLALVFMSLLEVTFLRAQTFRGAIDGTVTDPAGAVVPNVRVEATDTATGATHSTVTTADGQFSIQDLPLGTYEINVPAAGFAAYTAHRVRVTAGSVYTLAVKLSLAQENRSVEVPAAALTVDTTTATQSDTIPEEAVQSMPLNGRDFTQLVAIAPGYGGYSINGGGTINGARNNGVNWQLDGTDNNDFWYNIPAINQGGVSGIAGVIMPIDAIDEFSTQTESMAESGRDAGGTVNVILKSGTNQLHGSAYYYNRNEFYAAHSPFFVPSPEFPRAPRLRNQNYGFTLGGPMVRNKAFFFLGFRKAKLHLRTQRPGHRTVGGVDPERPDPAREIQCSTEHPLQHSVFNSLAQFDQHASGYHQQLLRQCPGNRVQLQRRSQARLPLQR